MAYSAATFYIDYATGNDAARTALTVCIASNPSGTTTLITKVGHGLQTGDVVTASSFTAWLNAPWKITRLDNDTFTLDDAVWQATAVPSGTITPFGGSRWNDAWKTVTTGATAARIQPGDTIRISKSPDPTNIGKAKWVGTAMPVTAKNIASSTNASPIQITLNSHGYNNGDFVQIAAHTTNAGANGFWKVQNVATNTFEIVHPDGTNSVGTGTGTSGGTVFLANNKVVVLETALTKTIDNCETAWSAGAVTPTANPVATTAKEGSYCGKLITGATSSANTLYAYKDLGGTINFSGYDSITFWWMQEVITKTTSWRISLCSNANGTGEVDTFLVPTPGTLGRWTPFKVAKSGGGTLSNSIKSIAIYSDANAPTVSKYIRWDNISACNANSISLQSLFSMTTTAQDGTCPWYAPQSIDNTYIILDNIHDTKSYEGRGHYGASNASIDTYARETLKLFPSGGASTSYSASLGDNGTAGNLIYYEGGFEYNTTNQNGETWFDHLNGNGYGVYFTGRSYCSINRLNCSRCGSGTGLNNGVITNMSCMNAPAPIIFDTDNCTLSFNWLCNGTYNYFRTSHGVNVVLACKGMNNCTDSGLYNYGFNNDITCDSYSNNVNNGIQHNVAYQNTYRGSKFDYNGLYGISGGAGSTDNKYINCSATGNGTAVFNQTTNKTYLYNFDMTGIEFTTQTAYSDTRIYSQRHDNTDNNHWTFTDGATINMYSGTNHNSATSLFWKYDITSSTRNSNYKLCEPIARIPIKANQTATFKCWVKKGHATNVGGAIFCAGSQLTGISDTRTTCTTDDADWHELSLVLQPTQAGIVEITGEAWYVAGNDAVYFDDCDVLYS